MSTVETVEVNGRSVRVTHPDKVMYPSTGTTKRDVIDYLLTVAPWLVGHAHDRPATRKRWVDGVGTAEHPGQFFFERNLRPGSAPDWVTTRQFEHQTRPTRYPLVNDAATLIWLAQLDALEIHTPQWRYGPRGGIHGPDRMVFDLDPGEGASLAQCADVAHLVREELDARDLLSVPVTTGSSGIHVYAEVTSGHRPSVVRDTVHRIADDIARKHPDLVVSTTAREDRRGKVLIDWSQNDGVKTTCVPYSLRGRARPTVAAPRTWDEIDSGVRQLGFRQVADRLLSRGDPLGVLLGPGDGGPSFVIQEHDASHLHWDFRLEHDGVLVSWALPKGVPRDSGTNRLAVQTEDHPLSYGGFEGRINEGNPGAGTVDIWDEGSYSLKKWQDDEIVVTLYGRQNGGLGGEPQKFSLIRTRMNDDSRNWLLHLMSTE